MRRTPRTSAMYAEAHPLGVTGLVIPDDLLAADSPTEYVAIRRYELALMELAHQHPQHRMVREGHAAVTALLATAGRDGTTGVRR